MSAIWISDIQNQIYTIVKTRAKKKLSKYADLNFTTDSEAQIETKFPTVYVHFLPFAQMGKSIDGHSVNAVTCGAQIEVTVSKAMGQTVANEVIYKVVDEFLALGFTLAFSPEFYSTGNETKRILCRVNRIIASGDIIK